LGDSPRTEAADSRVCEPTVQDAKFERYIEPLLTDARPSSCNQCHLSGVDVELFVRASACQTMACMLDQGWVDLERPEASKVLEFILQADPQSALITSDVIEREYDGFKAWIEYNAECFASSCGEFDDPCVGSGEYGEVYTGDASPLGSCEETALVQSFEQKVFAWRGRCQTCHNIEGAGAQSATWAIRPPAWIASGTDAESARLTMYNVVGMGAVDVESPNKSNLLAKPLGQDMSYETELGTVVGVEHLGGLKIHPGGRDATLDDFASWIGEYVACFAE
jgi:hypothetical protein